MSLNDMYARKDPTEVPSYFLSALASGLGNLATTAGSAIAGGASNLGQLASKIPLVGSVVGPAINNLGSGIGQMVGGNFGSGLSSLYTGADKLLGGILPGGQALGQGWIGNLYGAADSAMGGYLPGGQTPAAMQAGTAWGTPGGPQITWGDQAGFPSPQRIAGWENGWGNQPLFNGVQAGQVGGSLLDKLTKGANIVQAGMGIYDLTRANQPERDNVRAMQILSPGGGGGGSPQMIAADPAMVSAPSVVGGGQVPSTFDATGGQAINQISNAELIKSNKELMEDLEDFLKRGNNEKRNRVGKAAKSPDISI